MVASISSIGTPRFQFVPRGQKSVQPDPQSSGVQSESTPDVSSDTQLEQKVRSRQRNEVQKEGKELVNLRIVEGSISVENSEDQSGDVFNSSNNLKAVQVTRDEGGGGDFDVSVLKVFPNGQTEEIYRSDSLKEINRSNTSTDLNLRGSLLDQRI
ncbi:MAG: hypothetical protein ABEJ65_03300 [bacterium]